MSRHIDVAHIVHDIVTATPSRTCKHSPTHAPLRLPGFIPSEWSSRCHVVTKQPNTLLEEWEARTWSSVWLEAQNGGKSVELTGESIFRDVIGKSDGGETQN